MGIWWGKSARSTLTLITIADDLTCYDLLFSWNRLISLEEEVTECTWQRQITVNSIELDPATGIVDSLHFFWIVWLVVVAECNEGSVSRADCTRVTCIRTVKLSVLYEDRDGCRSRHLLFYRLVVVHCRVAFEKSLQKVREARKKVWTKAINIGTKCFRSKGQVWPFDNCRKSLLVWVLQVCRWDIPVSV